MTEENVEQERPYADWTTDALITRLAAPFPPPGERQAVGDELRRRAASPESGSSDGEADHAWHRVVHRPKGGGEVQVAHGSDALVVTTTSANYTDRRAAVIVTPGEAINLAVDLIRQAESVTTCCEVDEDHGHSPVSDSGSNADSEA